MRPAHRAALAALLLATACGTSAPPAADASTPDLAAADRFALTDLVACTLVKPYAARDAACDACAQARCCAEVNACYGAADCDEGYVNCFLACLLIEEPDGGAAPASDGGTSAQACVAKCGADHPTGKALFEAATGCVETRCASDCS